jgi:hypothetical protein
MGLETIPQFFNCGDYHIDFFMLNYLQETQCVNSSLITKYNFINVFRNYSVPTIMTSGCKNGTGHDYSEIDLIFGNEGAQSFSGAVVRDYLDDVLEHPQAVYGK